MKRRAGALWALILFIAGGVIFGASLNNFYRLAYPVKFYQTVIEESLRNDIDPALVFAVIRTESNFRADVRSEVGARGLMQITEETFNWIATSKGYKGDSFADLYDPLVNIKYGTALLRILSDEFGSQVNVLCAYYAGWGSVTEWLSNPDYSPDGKNLILIPFKGTAHYVDKVETTKAAYQSLYSF